MMDKGQVRTQALALFLEIYAVSDSGGPLHVQLDDMNLGDEFFEDFSPGWWKDKSLSVEQEQRIQIVSIGLSEILKTWTEVEREEFVAYAHGVHSKVAYHWDEFTPSPTQLGYAHGQALRSAAVDVKISMGVTQISSWLIKRAERIEAGELC